MTPDLDELLREPMRSPTKVVVLEVSDVRLRQILWGSGAVTQTTGKASSGEKITLEKLAVASKNLREGKLGMFNDVTFQEPVDFGEDPCQPGLRDYDEGTPKFRKKARSSHKQNQRKAMKAKRTKRGKR